MKLLFVFLVCAGSAFATVQTTAADSAWLPVTDAERALKEPVVDKKAGVEAIFWRVHVMDEWVSGTAQRVSIHYVRLKVFNEEGKAKAAHLDIPYGDRSSIMYLTGRTIKPDGTILELGKDASQDRVDVKSGGRKSRVRSFAMPGVEVGSIIEYRWREVDDSSQILYLRLQFQHEFPIQKATYFVRPLSGEYNTYKMSIWPYSCTPSPWKQDPEGFYVTSLESIPAFKEEPMMPGEPNVRHWALVFYHEDGARNNADKYWDGVGRKTYGDLKMGLKANDEVRRIAMQAVEGAKTDDEKCVRLLHWIRANMRDLWSRQVSEEERNNLLKKLPRDRRRTATEVYKSGIGDHAEMNMLFAAMAMEVGLDARPALVGSRDELTFSKTLVEKFFLPDVDMAVSIGGQWKLFDVTTRLLPPGMLPWRQEGVAALVTDPKLPAFVTSHLSAPAESSTDRKARLVLSDEGTLEGDIEEKWTGHAAEIVRQEIEGESAQKQQEDTKEEILRRFPQSEITNLKLENADDPEQTLVLSFHIRIPAYADRTGKRVIFQPLFFHHGDALMFSATDRQYDIYFPFAWHEKDSVSIKLPAGYQLEKAQNPGSVDFGVPGSYDLAMTAQRGTLYCTRELTFGKNEGLQFARELYPKVKGIFDDIHRRDETTFSLRQADAPAAVPAEAAK